jgi:hypothetical protein
MERGLRFTLLAALLALPLGGCVDELAKRQAFLATLIGKSEPDLVRAMGVPSASFETGGHRFLAYQEVWTDYYPATPGPWGWYWGGGFPAEAFQRSCTTTIELNDGRVSGYTLRGNSC